MNTALLVLIVYWILTLTWTFIVAVSLALYLLKRNFRQHKDSRIIFVGILLYAIQYCLEIYYWTIAVTSRIGFMDESISKILYSNYYVAFVKFTDLLSGVLLLLVVLRLFKLMDKRIERFISTKYLENSHESIVILDLRKKIIHLNRAAEIKSNVLYSKRVISPDPKDSNIYNEVSISPFFNIDNTQIEGFNVNIRRIINGEIDVKQSPFFSG